MRGDIEELERRRTAEHREVAHDGKFSVIQIAKKKFVKLKR